MGHFSDIYFFLPSLSLSLSLSLSISSIKCNRKTLCNRILAFKSPLSNLMSFFVQSCFTRKFMLYYNIYIYANIYIYMQIYIYIYIYMQIYIYNGTGYEPMLQKYKFISVNFSILLYISFAFSSLFL